MLVAYISDLESTLETFVRFIPAFCLTMILLQTILLILLLLGEFLMVSRSQFSILFKKLDASSRNTGNLSILQCFSPQSRLFISCSRVSPHVVPSTSILPRFSTVAQSQSFVVTCSHVSPGVLSTSLDISVHPPAYHCYSPHVVQSASFLQLFMTLAQCQCFVTCSPVSPDVILSMSIYIGNMIAAHPPAYCSCVVPTTSVLHCFLTLAQCFVTCSESRYSRISPGVISSTSVDIFTQIRACCCY